MKTNTILLALVATTILALPRARAQQGDSQPAPSAEATAAQSDSLAPTDPAQQGNVSLPEARFVVSYQNGVVMECEFQAQGSVRQSQANPPRQTTGAAAVENKAIQVRYADHRVEVWQPQKNGYAVSHWASIRDFEKGERPEVGTAEKQSFAPAKSEGNLTVHEWGTFTLLQGSDGQIIEWYQPRASIAELPGFVQNHNPFGKIRAGNLLRRGKFVGLDDVRMETPVLYFYPDREMNVEVIAKFPCGHITEAFPPSIQNAFGDTIWKGRLLRPDAQEKSQIPVATGPEGRHYAAARAVPDAWLFRNTEQQQTAIFIDPKLSKVAPIDHFIFYRGAGQLGTWGLRAMETASPDRFELHNGLDCDIANLIALRVSGGQASWLRVKELKRLAYDETTRQPLNVQTITFPAPQEPVDKVAETLRKEMVDILTLEGLTPAEAAAMVATWDNLWFTEPGIRLLAPISQEMADAMVPLHISPAPQKLERVFVARLEILTREKERTLQHLLSSDASKFEENRKALEELELGRFHYGGLERAMTLSNQTMQQRFSSLLAK